CLIVFKMKGVYGGIRRLMVRIIVGMGLFKLGGSIGGGGSLEGFYEGIMAIGFIVMMGVWLYKIGRKRGEFGIVEDSMGSV
ncbi:L-lactate permease, partial [Staphylococcus saprophyticus]|uniref:L-lactate permease n=1 Tax=Staphylococcus saprophyticus TaxID=29385 RepID=UPI0021B1E1BD